MADTRPGVFIVRTLIVDAAPVARSLLERPLLELGTVHVAHDGTSALTQVRNAVRQQRPFDLIVVGLGLADMDGLLLRRQIHQVPGVSPATPIMMTARADRGPRVLDMVRRRAGACLRQPFTSRALFDQLAQLGLLDQVA